MSSPCIHVLPDELINLIAAGEVVENAASVVKELIENALDAGAGRITVEIARGGLSLIKVSDDGCGMTPQDARMALVRHATSKIANADDLLAIRTLGFRGEALPSIASVSRLTLITRTRDAEVGVRLVVADNQTSEEPFVCPPGTTVIVEDLFANVPARLKFQKGERSQTAAVDSVVGRLALARPDVHFTLVANNRTVADYPPCKRLADRVAQVFSSAGQLVQVSASGDGIELNGVIGGPKTARQDPFRVVLLVNKRPVVDLTIRKAVVSAYGPLLEPGHFPIAVLDIDVDPKDIDVNVHPRKTEVRFRRHKDIAALVFSAVEGALATCPWVVPSKPISNDSTSTLEFREPMVPWCGPHSQAELELTSKISDKTSDALGMRYAGQLWKTVLVLEGPDTVIFVDQHAAHERVNYEYLLKALRTNEIATDTLLFPELVHLDKHEATFLPDVTEALTKLGFDVEVFSGDSLAVRAIPAIMKGRSAATVIHECLATVMEERESGNDQLLRKIIATIACHASVRAGDSLSEKEALALLNAMEGIDLAAYCPHGRQAMVVYPKTTVLRWFGR